VALLLQAAYPDSEVFPDEDLSMEPVVGDKPIKTSHGVLYIYRHAHNRFPTEWTEAMLRREAEVPGPMITMFSSFHALVRPPELYELYAEQGFYDADAVHSYVEKVRERQADFRNRLLKNTVRHVYSKQALVEFFVSGRWRQLTLPPDMVTKHVDLVVALLDQFEKFHVGLSSLPIPLHATVVGHRSAFVEMLHFEHPAPAAASLFGFETNRLEIVVVLEEQFDSIWDSEAVETGRAEVRAWLKHGWKEDARRMRDELDAAIQ
jgi:hypothetical protein